MPIICSGAAIIEHGRTGNLAAVAAEELDWRQESAPDGREGEVLHSAAIDHPKLGELSWKLWEYPAGKEARRETSVGNHILKRDLTYKLEKPGKKKPDQD